MKEKKRLSVVIRLIFSLAFSPVFTGTESFGEFGKFQKAEFEQTEEATWNLAVIPDSSNVKQEDKPETANEQNQEASKQQEDTSPTFDSVDNGSENLEEEQRMTTPTIQEITIVKNQTTEDFIEAIRTLAKNIACKYDLYASVMIAQAILESASGTSSLSTAPNYNLFGIKGDYKGATVVMKTKEDDSTGALFTIDSGFRKYPSYKECLEDYAALLKNGLVGNPQFYKGTWKSETRNYLEATEFLTGKYATDIQYAEKLNQLISVYELTSYDEQTEEKIKEEQEPDKNMTSEASIEKQAINFCNIIKVRSLMLQKMHKRQVQNELSKLLVNRLNYYFAAIFKLIKV